MNGLRLLSRSASLLKNGQRQLFRSLSTRPPVTVFSEDENMLRESVRRFAKEEVAPQVRKMDETANLDSNILKRMFELGYMGIETPEQYGGTEMSFTSMCIVIEELAKVDPGISVICDVHNTLLNTIMRKYGTPAQHEKYLPLLAQSKLGSFCLSEAGSGSDAFAMKTRAERHGDYYVINGTKSWITNAQQADLFVVLANADPSKGYKGITAFIVERGTDGLKIGKKEDKLGIRASSTCEVNFSDVKVPVSAVVGNVGHGYKIAIESLNEGRIGIGAQMLGLAQGVYETTIPYLHERKQFGKRIADFQGMQFQYAEALVQIEAAKLLVYNAARLKENGLPFVTEAAMAKLYASRVAESVASQCINWMGGVGFSKSFLAEKFYRDAKIGQIYEGTSNLQLQTIAKHIQKEFTQQ